ncbi:MAG: 4Fe-4S binding protein [Spirochaetota bacterium]
MGTGFTFDFEHCTECQRCMIACSVAKERIVFLKRSRISIVRAWPELPEILVCRFDDCAGQPCIEACPVGAISCEGGLVLIDAETCTGCEACVLVCPSQAIIMGEGIALKCDFCGGAPECVKACGTLAISRKGA